MKPRSLFLALIAATVAAMVAWSSTAALAAPETENIVAPPASITATASVGPASVTFAPTRNTVAQGTGFRFGVDISTAKQVDFVLARMRLLMPSGALIYQKTFVEQSLESTSVSFTYERGIDDIDLDAGAYPVEMSVDVEASGTTSHTVLPGALYVYDPKRPRLPVALVARISAQPLTDPQGRFANDPARFTRARDDARQLAESVLATPEARLTLSLSPVMVSEWQDISDGYVLLGAEGTLDVPPTDPVAQQYAATLDAIRRAIATGRLEILADSYADADLFELRGADMLEDIGRQYDGGKASLAGSIGATDPAGAAPPRGVPTEALTRLARAGVRYVVVPGDQARRRGKSPTGDVYTAGDTVIPALVADAAASRALASSPTVDVLDIAFGRYAASETPRPLPLLVAVGPGAASVDAVTSAATELAQAPWARLVTAAEAAQRKPVGRVSLRGHKPDKDAPKEYWSQVREGRELADALAEAMPANAPEAQRAVRQSLVAAGSAWAGIDGSWAPATSGLAFAMTAIDSANDILERVTLTAYRTTLAGARGTIPVTINNDTPHRLRVALVAEPASGVKLDGPARREVTLDPGDNFVEVPVRLEQALASTVDLTMYAGSHALTTKTVSLQGSYLDRLVVGGAVIALLAGLLFFVIRRVRAVESGAAEDQPEQLSLDIDSEANEEPVERPQARDVGRGEGPRQ